MPTTTDSAFDIESILHKVQMLFAKADDASIDPAEAKLFREKAEALMIKFRIDAEEARERGEAPSMKPTWSKVYLGKPGEWSRYLYGFATLAADHTGVRIMVDMNYETRSYDALVCGFGHDVSFFELLYTTIMESFSMRLEPQFNPDESLEANALRLRMGGMERHRIAKVLGLGSGSSRRDGTTAENWQKAQNRRVTKMIKEEAERIGKPEIAETVLGRSFNAKTYRTSYAAGFYDEIYHRMWTLRMNRNDGGLVLKRAKEEVDEAWYERFPNLRPKPLSTEMAAHEPCKKCKASKRGACRDHFIPKGRDQAYNYSALDKGRAAARTVDLGGTVKHRSVS